MVNKQGRHNHAQCHLFKQFLKKYKLNSSNAARTVDSWTLYVPTSCRCVASSACSSSPPSSASWQSSPTTRPTNTPQVSSGHNRKCNSYLIPTVPGRVSTSYRRVSARSFPFPSVAICTLVTRNETAARVEPGGANASDPFLVARAYHVLVLEGQEDG